MDDIQLTQPSGKDLNNLYDFKETPEEKSFMVHP